MDQDKKPPSFTIVGLGEALYDIFGDHRHLGGAPLNLAVCADQLARAHHGRGVVVSSVGSDALGHELIETLHKRGLDASFIQTTPDHPTSTVIVDIDDGGQPSYNIVRNVAWDALQFSEDLEALAQQCDAVAFGSLAQRSDQSHDMIHRFLKAADRAVRLFDVNLRQDYFDARILQQSCELATIVKLNEAELPCVCDLLNINAQSDGAAAALRATFDLEMVVLTRGERGTRLYTANDIIDGKPAHCAPASDADAVGAGDACGAALLVSRVLKRTPQQIADLANRCGAYVAAQPGGTPPLPDDLIASV